MTGSAALFYLTNSEYRSEQSVKLRRQVIQVVLNGMESYQEVTVSPYPPGPACSGPATPFPAQPVSQVPQGLGLLLLFLAWLCSAPLPTPLSHDITPRLWDTYSGPVTQCHHLLPPSTPGPCSAASGPLPMLTPQPFHPGTLCGGVLFSKAASIIKVIKSFTVERL